jgi:hypothetical protein
MADIFDRIRGRAASVITKFGGIVTFIPPDIPAIEDPNTHTWSDPIPGEVFTGNGIQTAGEPEQLDGITAALALKSPIVLLVAAKGLSGVPVPTMSMEWSGTRYVIRYVKAVAPNNAANPIYYTVVGDV